MGLLIKKEAKDQIRGDCRDFYRMEASLYGLKGEYRMDTNIYPLTIVYDRYMGTYSGGRWTAWPFAAFKLPEEIDADDITCCNFWSGDAKGYVVGKGDSPAEAVRDLEKKLGCYPV